MKESGQNETKSIWKIILNILGFLFLLFGVILSTYLAFTSNYNVIFTLLAIVLGIMFGASIAVVICFYVVKNSNQAFLSIVSHQICSPLVAIKWLSSGLLDGDKDLSNSQRDDLLNIQQMTSNLSAFVNSLLNLTRLNFKKLKLTRDKFDLREIMDEVFAEMSVKMEEKNLEIVKDYPSSNYVILGDKNIFYLIFENLVSNAVKYSYDNEKINVKLCIKSAGEEFNGVVLDKKSCIFVVTNSGLGIPDSQKNQVFEKLMRGENVVSKNIDGNGLGLFIIKKFINLLGGDVNFKSTENVNTVFYSVIPIKIYQRKNG